MNQQKFKNNPEQHLLIEEIDQWEINSIEKIKQRAKQCREISINYTIEIFNQVEIKLNHSNEQLIPLQNKNEFNEIDLDQLKRELNQPTNLPIKQQSNSFINKYFVILPLNKIVKIFFFNQR